MLDLVSVTYAPLIRSRLMAPEKFVFDWLCDQLNRGQETDIQFYTLNCKIAISQSTIKILYEIKKETLIYWTHLMYKKKLK